MANLNFKVNNSTKDNEFRKDRFKYDADKDIYICPAGQQLEFFENTSKNGMKYRKYKCSSLKVHSMLLKKT